MHTPAPIELMNVCLLRDDANRMLPVYENPDVTSMFYAPDGDGWTAVYR